MFTLKELCFLQESIRWAELSYIDKSAKRLNSIPDYYINEYRPKLDEFHAIKQKLKEEQNNLKGGKI